MTIFFLTLGAGNCLLTAWQDFRYREIHILPLGLLALGGVCYRCNEDGWGFAGDWMINLAFLATILGVVWVVYRVRGTEKVMDVKMGWGDVIFLMILGIWFKPFWFLLFYSVNTFFLSVFFLIGRMTGLIPKTYPIPLAGILGITFSVFMPFWHYYLAKIYLYS
ncbi:MAG: prepilin peptidase [Bacteroidia bacterium]